MNDEPRDLTGQALRGYFCDAEIEVLLIDKYRIVGTLINTNIHRVPTWLIRAFASDEKNKKTFPHFDERFHLNWVQTQPRFFCLLLDNWICKWQRVSQKTQRETTKQPPGRELGHDQKNNGVH